MNQAGQASDATPSIKDLVVNYSGHASVVSMCVVLLVIVVGIAQDCKSVSITILVFLLISGALGLVWYRSRK